MYFFTLFNHFSIDFFTEIYYRIRMLPIDYFKNPKSVSQKQYEALRAFFLEHLSAAEVARKFGYTLRAFNSLVGDFRRQLSTISDTDPFFAIKKKGRKFRDNSDGVVDIITEMRKMNHSVGEIKTALDAKGHRVSERFVYLTLRREGFARLPRRSKQQRNVSGPVKLSAPKSMILEKKEDTFQIQNAGLLVFLPYIQHSGIADVIAQSLYPGTQSIDRVASIMAFLALKLSNIRRYSADDLWCMDRGAGLFAGLNVLPKTAWFSSYSSRITREMNRHFLKSLHKLWQTQGLLGDTVNLDFVTIPYWGDDAHLENNWSGKRNKVLSSMLSVLAQESDSGIIDYGDTNVMHRNEHAVVLEFLDFYRQGNPTGQDLKYLVFDSKFTNYENLRKLNDEQILFITIRRRGKNMVDQINQIPANQWKRCHIMNADGKGRTLNVFDDQVMLNEYNGLIRQVCITGHGKVKPAVLITNDFDIPVDKLIRKYCQRWLVEKTIAEQTDFFHLNRVSSSMVIKVDFDLTMTILAHNIYRLFAQDLDRYSHFSDTRLYEKFIDNAGEVLIHSDKIDVKLKKKRDLPKILETMNPFHTTPISWLHHLPLQFSGLSHS